MKSFIHNTFLFILLLSLSSCSKSPGFLEPQWRASEDSSRYVNDIGFPEAFDNIKSDSLYNRFYVEFVHIEGQKDYYKYAKRHYKERCKETGFPLVYIVVNSHPANHCIVTFSKNAEKRVLEDVLPGNLFRLEQEFSKDPFSFITHLAQHRKESLDTYNSSSVFRKMGYDNPILEAINLILDPICLPGDSIIYYLLFFIPYAIGMAILASTNSLYTAIAIALILAFWFGITWQKRKHHSKSVGEILYWAGGFFLFSLTFIMLVNTLYPSSLLLIRMRFSGYAYIADTIYKPFYLSFIPNVSSIVLVVILAVLYLVYRLVVLISEKMRNPEKELDTDDIFQKLIIIVAAAYACGNRLSLIVLGFYLFMLLLKAYPLFTSKYEKEYPDFPLLISLFIIFTLGFTVIYVRGPLYPNDANQLDLIWYYFLMPLGIGGFYGLPAWYYFIKFTNKSKSFKRGFLDGIAPFTDFIDLYKAIEVKSTKLELGVYLFCLVACFPFWGFVFYRLYLAIKYTFFITP
ncbi:MAG: hypothetical protein IJL91_12505 [Bacteroidales bacterium]|nr:hypothetical protein [Bacteroidales bacterium]